MLVGVAVALWVAPGAWARSTVNARTTADEPQYLMTALSLAEDGSLDVADERADGRYRDWHEVGLPLQEEIQADGSRVSPHDPLLPALLAVPIALGGWLAAKLALAALTGLLAAALVWVAARRFAVPLHVAVLTVAAFAASAPLAVYGTQVYPEIVAALAVTVAIGAITGDPTHRATLALGAAAVALPWLSVKYSPVAAVLLAVGVARLWRSGRRGESAALATAVVACGALFVAAHVAWYGGVTPYTAGSHFTSGELGVIGSSPDYAGRSMRLAGLLTDRSFGLAVWQPAYLLGVAALVAIVRRRPRGWSALVLPFAAGYLNAAFVALTMHGWWFPGRQVVVVLPAVVLAVAWWAARVRVARHALGACALFGASVFAWLVAQALLGELRVVVSFDALTHPLWRAWRGALPDYRDLTGRDGLLHAVWLGIFALLATWGWHSAPARRAAPETSEPNRPQDRTGEPNMRTRTLAAAITGALLLAGCGGGDDGADVRQIGGEEASGSASASGTAECTPVGDAAESETTVNATLDEYSVALDAENAATGAVHFATENVGDEPHELVVVNAESPDDLPVGEDKRVSEDGLPEGTFIGEIEAFPGGQTCDGTFDLDPGTYVLFCNLVTAPEGEDVSHFLEGMATTFTVTG